MSRKDAIQEKLRRLNTDTKKIYEALDGVAEENLYNNSYLDPSYIEPCVRVGFSSVNDT